MPHDLSVLEDKIPLPSTASNQGVRHSGAHSVYLLENDGVLDMLAVRKRTFMKGCDLVHEEQHSQNAYMLYAGWACSYKLLRNGSRPIINFHVPGDLIGIRQLLIPSSADNLCAITRIEVGEIDAEILFDAFRDNGSLAKSILWSAFRDEAIVAQHLVDVGRRRPINRVAHFFLELGSRLNRAGLATKTAYQCPLTQSLIADALGLTAVHFNRVLRQLRELNAMTFHEGRVEFVDCEKLEHLADFDSAYLL